MKRKYAWIHGIVVILLMTWVGSSTLALSMNSPASDKKKWTAPAEAKKLKNPLPNTKKVIEAGKKLYQLQCATCHGTSGKGDGMAGKFLPKKPGNFLLPQFQKQTDGEIFWKITHGRTPMPAFKDILTDEQRWQLVRYLRTFKSK